MYQNKKIGVIIAAAGSGSRMGSGIAKQYMKIHGLPAIVKVVKVFAQQDAVDCIWIVTGADQISFCSEILKQYKVENDVKSIIAGGKERQDSVFRGLQGLDEEVDYVLIHDGARPFVQGEVINDVIAAMVTKGAAVAAVPVKDTIRQKTNESGATKTLNRENLFAVQTPQGFEKNLLVSAYVRAFEDGFYGTDDAVLVERLGVPVTIVMGGYDNIKITTKEDLPVEIKIGSGFDVHRLEAGRKLILGGVQIPFEKGLLGHSDADVLVHAIIDGLLGAAGLGDIGKHFPDTDCRYEGICSIALLERVSLLLQQQGYAVGNIDVTLMAEQPKIAPYIGAMIEILAQTLYIEQEKINIKATTTEKLGFVGREEGMACQAVCTLMKY